MNAHINGIDTHYLDAGDHDALPVVLIHGFPFSHQIWEPQIKILQNKFRVIAYDVRGHGRSGVGDGQYTLEFLVDDLIGLLDYLKIKRTALCGLSMGGYISLRAIERNPERILGLVLADTQSRADTNEAKLKRTDSIKSVKTNGVEAFAEVSVKSVFAPQSLTANLKAVEKIRRIIHENSAAGISGALLAMAARTDTTHALAGIKVATLILVGEHDGPLYKLAAQEMHDRISGSELHIISNAGHMSNLENPEEFNTHMMGFLAKVVDEF
jgi:3-oxoadipate enol-lactonase